MLHSDLNNLFGCLGGLAAGHGLGDVPGHGLFAVEVLVGLDRRNKVLGVQMHGRGINYGIDVVAFEQAHGIVVGVDAGDFGFGEVAAAGVGVSDGDALDVGLLERVVKILHAAIAGAYKADANAVVGAECAHGGHGCKGECAFACIS